MRYLREKGAPEMAGAVEPANMFYWRAYMHLRGSRQQGMGIGQIPFSEISAYSDWLGLTCPVDRGRLVRMIMAMDAAEMAAG